MFLNVGIDRWVADTLQRYVDHRLHTWIVAFVYLVISIGHAILLEISVKEYLAILPTFAGLRWIIHDLMLNLIRGRDWDYLGSGENAAKLDLFLAKLPVHMMISKLIFLGFMVILSLIIQNTYWFENLWVYITNIF